MIRCTALAPITDQSSVSAARRTVAEAAASMRFRDTAAGRAALVATELATNIVKHAPGGSILIGSQSGFEDALILISIDKGEGIGNVDRAMQDGYSTAGSPGTGLGAIVRVASAFDIYSAPGKGTVVLTSISENGTPQRSAIRSAPQMDIAGICMAKPGEHEPGDAWFAAEHGHEVTIGVADGLGHGPLAATAAAGFIAVLMERPAESLEHLLADAHAALRPTRGAAVGIARIEPAGRRLEFAGVGNIAGTIAGDGKVRKVVSLPGIVGHEVRKVQTFSYPWSETSALILQSDGIGSNWNLDAYPGLSQHPPAVVAAVLYRDFARGSDDATVVVAMNRKP